MFFEQNLIFCGILQIRKAFSFVSGVTIMTTKTVSDQSMAQTKRDVSRLIAIMTAAAWIFLGVGLLLSLFNMEHFNDRNTLLMVGIGFMVGSVHIYLIRTAIHLVHSRPESGGK
jgi:NADH:ubiquinone oxidoreductase subunit K